ncbi:MAG: hypothetical protein MUC88_20430 [Planctomycetes bacterium]|jgi:hypothetical protein|nr:hypothetical protein [Planctomycetota bacterium]
MSDSLLNTHVLMQNIDESGPGPKDSWAATLAIALIEISEAIEEQTDRLYDEQQEWDQSALAKLAKDVGVLTDAVGEQANKLDAFEQALQGVITHQGETAKLVQDLAEKVAVLATRRGGPD